MKLTTKQIKQLIKEELNMVLKENRASGDPYEDGFGIEKDIAPEDDELCKAKLKQFLDICRNILKKPELNGFATYEKHAANNLHRDSEGCVWHEIVNEIRSEYKKQFSAVGRKPWKIYKHHDFLHMLLFRLDKEYREEIEHLKAGGEEEYGGDLSMVAGDVPFDNDSLFDLLKEK